jgi:putative nucleotidyltransferase with HDIG domain
MKDIHRKPNLFSRISYRAYQFFFRLFARISESDLDPVYMLLPLTGQTLFKTMSRGDQRHALNVYHALHATGCTDKDLLAAALLHDVGKGGGRVRFFMRPIVVLMEIGTPRLLIHLAGNEFQNRVSPWRQPFHDAFYHAKLGAKLAKEAGLSPRIVEFIITHHDPHGPAAALHEVDEGQ